MCRRSIFVELVFILAFLLALCFSGPLYPQDVSGDTAQISKSELNSLLTRMLVLQVKYQRLQEKVQSLKTDSQNLLKELEGLRIELEDSKKQIAELRECIADLNNQLEISLQTSKDLRRDLQNLETNYKDLYNSFLLYQKEAERQLNAEKGMRKITTFLSWLFGGTTILFGVLYVVERFVSK